MTHDDAATEAGRNLTRTPLFITLFAIDTVALIAFFVLPDPIRWVAAFVAFATVSVLLLTIRRAEGRADADGDPGEPTGPTVY